MRWHTYIKNITWRLDSLNNNYGNFYPILLNDDSILSQDNRIWEYYYLSYISVCFIKVCYYECTNLKKYEKARGLPHQIS